MGGLLLLLTVLGGTALAYRLLRGAMRVALDAAELTMVAGLADISARRGDLTRLVEHQAAERDLRRARRRDALIALLWLVWLVVPLYLGWAREAYVAAAMLWLLPAAPLRPRPPGAER